MAKLGINTGSNADDGTGDSLRVGGGKINANFDEVYSLLTGASNNGTTLLSGIVTSITAGSNITLSGGPTGAIQITAAALTGTGFFTSNSTGIHTLGSVGIGTTTAENNGLSVPLGNVKVGKGLTTLNLNVAGVTSFTGGDINVSGDNYDMMWDASVDTLEFGDNAKIAFGAGSDLTLYHDASDSWIKDQATGNLLIDSNGAAVKITKAGAAETMAEFNTDGPVKLFHNNVRVLETVSTGATVVGDLYVGGDLFVLDDVTNKEMNSVNLNITGVSTFSGDLRVGVSTFFIDVSRGQIGLGTDVLTGSHLLDVDGAARFSGIVTATAFSGPLEEGNTSVEVTDTGSNGQVSVTVDGSETYRFDDGSLNFKTGTVIRMTGIAGGTSTGLHIDSAAGNGRLAVFGTSGNLQILDSTGGGDTNMAVFTKGGSVDLYHGGSSKIITDKHGAIITGVATATGFSGPLTGTATGLSGSPSVELTNIVGAAASIAGIVTATTFIGALTGNASGSSGSCTGNSVTATDLAINATNRLVIQTGNNATDILAAGNSGEYLISAGAGSAPTWSSALTTTKIRAASFALGSVFTHVPYHLTMSATGVKTFNVT